MIEVTPCSGTIAYLLGINALRTQEAARLLSPPGSSDAAPIGGNRQPRAGEPWRLDHGYMTELVTDAWRMVVPKFLARQRLGD